MPAVMRLPARGMTPGRSRAGWRGPGRELPPCGLGRRRALKVFRAAARFVSCAAVTMQTEVDIRNSLFPKEQVPASTPIPPRGRDHSSRHDGFLSLLRQHRSWRNERLGTIFLCSVEVPRRRWYGVGQVRSLYRLSLRPGSLCRPGKVEVLLFWAFGIVVMILSGAVAIYASHLHLWDVH
jgi:hypothetical protein